MLSQLLDLSYFLLNEIKQTIYISVINNISYYFLWSFQVYEIRAVDLFCAPALNYCCHIEMCFTV